MNSPGNCTTDIPWWTSYGISVGIFALGFVIIGLLNLINIIKRHTRPTAKVQMLRRKSRLLMNPIISENDSDYNDDMDEEAGIASFKFLKFILWCERVTSERSPVGRVLCLIQVVFNLLSWAIYLSFTYYKSEALYIEGYCYNSNTIGPKWIDFLLNIFFGLHFILRAFAAIDIIKFWIHPTTLLDICIIPNVIVSTFLPLRRQGMSFLRVFYLRHIYDVIFVNFGLVRISSTTKVFNLGLYLFSVWLIGGGFMHMEENTGDFWSDNNMLQNWTYWESVYFILETVSTVGYGDYSPKTISGQIIVCIYIIYAITLFATSLPQIVYAIKDSKYNEKYVTRHGEKHIIVTGQFINSTIKVFLKVFINKRTRKKFRNMKIIIMNSEPSDRNLSMYLKKFSSSLIYLVGSIQNINDMKRVNADKSKAIVILSLPFSDKINDDDSENIMSAISLKAQQERVRTIVQLHLYSNKILLKMFPRWNKHRNDVIVCLDELRLGLMAYNCLVPGIATLITNLMTFTQSMKTPHQWRKYYEDGLHVRLYNVEFSDDFHGMPCLEVALIIYKLWDVCLLAIKNVKNLEINEVTINPMMENQLIDTTSMIAIVMARDENLAHRVPFYCAKCSNLEPFVICDCLLKTAETPIENAVLDLKKLHETTPTKKISYLNKSEYLFSLMVNKPCKVDNDHNHQDIDETETFYWGCAPKLEEICIDIKMAETREFSNHILVCLCGSGEGTIDLCNFMMPLRFRSLIGDNLRPIVILGNKIYFENNKWGNIKNFPMFIIVNGSPIQARDLRAAGLFNCYSCAIINGNDDSSESSDKQSLICATLVKSMMKDHRKDFNMITELREDEIACHFSSSESFEIDNKLSVQHSEPYASGIVFTNSILYRCIFSIYYNPDTFSFISAFINGPRGDLVEKMFGCGLGLLPKCTNKFKTPVSDIVFQLMSVNEPPFNNMPELLEGKLTYEYLFEWALKTKRILCLGLYRSNFGKFRYVFTHPQKSTEISVTDMVYCGLSNNYILSKI